MSSAAAEGSPPTKGISRRRIRLGGQDGQSLVIVVVAMFVIIAFAAIAVDLDQWYRTHHQAQVSADASALAAANCLARRACTSPTPTGDAGTTATAYAVKNGVTIPAGDISFNTANDQVTVTTATAAPISFAGLFSVHPSVSAKAVASWAGGSIPYSFFSANTYCGSSSGPPLGIWVNQNGGGGSTILGMYTDGQYYNQNDSGNSYYNGQISSSSTCGGGTAANCKSTALSQSCWETKSSDIITAPPVKYPTCYAEPGVASTPSSITSNCQTAPSGAGPTCLYAPDGYWTTDASAAASSADVITGPPPAGDAYCVGNAGNTSGSAGSNGSASTAPATSTSSCTSTSDGTVGSIYINTALPGSGYEFAGPCIVFNYPGNLGNVSLSSPANQPLVYGTANTQMTGIPDVFISTPNSGTTSMGTIFDPLGTVQFAGNNGFLGFVEAMNIQITANNNVNGTGPTATNMPGGDLLYG